MANVDRTQPRRTAGRRAASRPAGGAQGGRFQVDQGKLQATAAMNAARARNAQAGRGAAPVTNRDVAEISSTARGQSGDAVQRAVAGADLSAPADPGAMGRAIAQRRQGGTQPAAGGTQPAPGGTQPAAGGTQPAPGGTQPAAGGTQPAAGAQPPAGGAAQPSTPLQFGGTIQPGQTDAGARNDVSTAQNALTTLRGPDGQPYLKPGSYTPGTNDPATQEATTRFQRDQAEAGVVADGKIGPQTTAALNTALEMQGRDPSSMRTSPAQLTRENTARQAEQGASDAEAARDKAKTENEAAGNTADEAERAAHSEGAAVRALEQQVQQQQQNQPLETKETALNTARTNLQEAQAGQRAAEQTLANLPPSARRGGQQRAQAMAAVQAATATVNQRQGEVATAERNFPQPQHDQLATGRRQVESSQRAVTTARERANTAAGTAINTRTTAGQTQTAADDAAVAATRARATATTARGAVTPPVAVTVPAVGPTVVV